MSYLRTRVSFKTTVRYEPRRVAQDVNVKKALEYRSRNYSIDAPMLSVAFEVRYWFV